jgi:hypothetical protein
MNALGTLHERWTIAATAFVLIFSAGAARADRVRMPAAPLNAYRQECASCHMAYPPGLLPAESWRRIIGSLSKHYGTDASLDAETAHEIEQWLSANGATFKRVREAPSENRITGSAWFGRKHREIPAEVWRRASVRGPANCNACHAGAEQGRFSDDEVRIPR